MKIAILVPSYNRSEQLEKSIDSLLSNAKYPNNLLFAFRIDYGDEETKQFVYNLRRKLGGNVCVVSGPHKDRKELHTEYNNLWRCYFKIADFFIPWEDDRSMVTMGWDTQIFKYHESLNKPRLVCYQLQCIRNSNVNNWEFSCPVMSQSLLITMGCVSNHPDILNYIRYTCYLSKITVFIKTVQIKKLQTEPRDHHFNSFYDSTIIKSNISKHLIRINNNSMYKPCGLWIPKPKNWNFTKTIAQSKLEFKDKSF
jgi:hypothetical protein